MLIVPDFIKATLSRELESAGQIEIGGVMMGEQLEPGRFILTDISIQRSKGTVATFIRDASEALKAILIFFTKTNNQYKKFNYLGEWHSHPSFSLRPSRKDHDTMLRMVADPSVGANFLLLMIVRLDSNNELEASLHFYSPRGDVVPVELSI